MFLTKEMVELPVPQNMAGRLDVGEVANLNINGTHVAAGVFGRRHVLSAVRATPSAGRWARDGWAERWAWEAG